MSDKNLSDSVIMPREDFIELYTVAFDNHHVPSIGERVANTTQTTAVFAVMAGAVTAGTYGWSKCVDWLETRRHNRKLQELEKAAELRRTI